MTLFDADASSATGLLAGLPVDTFPKQVRVTVVPGVLLDHVDQQLT